MDTTTTIFSLLVMLFSVVLHEVAHGYAALFLGDRTAEYQGRLTLNPIKHMDLVGSVIVPLLSFTLGGYAFGWAKPVPFNPHNLRNKRWGELIVAAAGPLMNIVVAVLFGLSIRFMPSLFGGAGLEIVSIAIIINLTLALFNLMPVPPLDGSKIFWAFLPARAMRARRTIENLGIIPVLIFVMILWSLVGSVIPYLFTVLTGVRF
jgi:Zn-dependent protease